MCNYQRPELIRNRYFSYANLVYSNLLLSNQSIALRPHLIENFDFVAVPMAVWKHLYSWYSADWVISRKLVRDSLAGSFFEDDNL